MHGVKALGGLALELDRVSAHYSRSTRVRGASEGAHTPLSGVTFSVAPGELVCILGPNGAGKSTLVRVLAGTLAPHEGTVRLFGDDVARMDRRAIARTLAVVPQHTAVALGFAVRDVVMMGRAPHQDGWMRASDEDRAIVAEALAQCDLTAFAERPVDALSGGEQKRVAVARALAQRPRVLLLDEPGAYLDVRHQIALYDLLAEATARQGLACVVVMHDLTVAAQYASRVALMKGGRLLAIGSVEEVMTYALLRKAFDAELYVGVNELTGTRFFLPMRARPAE